MRITFPENLPIAAQVEKIADTLRRNQVVIVAGETGSGKTTQLPKICLQIGCGKNAKIACTEPRRVAAVSVAERVAQELSVPIGAQVGYQIRFAEKISSSTRLIFMTDGILLAQTRHDPNLLAYDAIIIDEAHERSLNIDFLLGIIRRLLPRRPDLKIIVSSATLDTAKFSEFFSSAPVISVEGRGYPVEIIYDRADLGGSNNEAANSENSDDEDEEMPKKLRAALQKLWRDHGEADTLIFVSGEADLHETILQLENAPLPSREILPLYGRMPPEQQRAIFYPRDLPRIIVATNVAETSLTVPRIRYVIDSGLARLKRYNAQSQVEMLPVEKISQSAANQRSGRCGRIAPGVCVRMFSEADFRDRESFTPPEILRSSLAAVILQMQSLDLGDLENFPFLDPPPRKLITSGYAELNELGALDSHRQITPLGRQLAQLPVAPRCGKILLAARQYQTLPDALTLVAALEIGDPRLRPPDQKNAADIAHRTFADQHSDFLTLLNMWKKVEETRGSVSGNQFHRFCHEHFLSWRRLREWRETREQLARIVAERLPENIANANNANRAAPPLPPKKKAKPNALPAENLHRALLTGLLGRVGVWRDEDKIYRGARGVNFHLHPASGIRGKTANPAWIMAAEIVETSRTFARTAAAIEPEWLEHASAHLLKISYGDPYFDEEFGCVRARAQATLFGLPIYQNRPVHYGAVADQAAAKAAREIFIREALVKERARCNLDFFAANQRLIAELREREQKLRRRDLTVSSESLFAFYSARLPAEINTVSAMERFVLAEQHAGREPLKLREADIALQADDGLSDDLFPRFWLPENFALTYKFSPGDNADGVTCAIPAGALAGLRVANFAWLIPGLLGEKAAQLLHGLPRGIRRELQPFPTTLAKILPLLNSAKERGEDFLAALAKSAEKISGAKITENDFSPENLPPFLRMNFVVLARDGKIIANGRDLRTLQQQCAASAHQSFLAAPKKEFERGAIRRWDFALPETLALTDGAIGYPALRDCGDCVALILCANSAQAERLTKRGVRRLLFIELATQVEKTARSLPVGGFGEAYFSAIGGINLREQILNAAADGLLATRKIPRSSADFGELVELFRREFYESAQTLGAATKLTLEKARELHSQIFHDYPPAKKISFVDLQRHFSALINSNFIADSGADYLPELPRYLDGVALRLKKMAENPARDQKRTQEISPFWDYCENEFTRLRDPKFKQLDDGVRRTTMQKIKIFRWQLEEFRVNLFAQEVGAHNPPSAEKLQAIMSQKIG